MMISLLHMVGLWDRNLKSKVLLLILLVLIPQKLIRKNRVKAKIHLYICNLNLHHYRYHNYQQNHLKILKFNIHNNNNNPDIVF